MLKHIKTKILIFLIPIIAIIVTFTFIVSISIGQSMLDNETRDKMLVLDELKSSEIQNLINEMNSITVSIVSNVSKTYNKIDFDEYETILSDIMGTNPNIYGVAIILEPYVLGDDISYSATYAQKNEDGTIYSDTEYTKNTYNFYGSEYYELAKKSDSLSFSKSTKDKISGKNIIVSSMPIKDDNGNFIGCVATKIQLDSLSAILNTYANDFSKLYIIDENGIFIAHEDIENVKNGVSVYDLNNEELNNALENEIYKNNEGVFNYTNEGVKYTAFYNTISNFNWKLINVIPYKDLTYDITDKSSLFFILAALNIVVLALLMMYLINRYVEKPIKVLLKEVELVANNTYKPGIPEELKNNKDEFGTLGYEIDIMKTKLKNYQNELEDAVNKNLSFAEEMKVQNDSLIKNENQLIEALNYRRAILNSLPDLLFVVNLDGQIIEQVGYNSSKIINSDDFVGNYFYDILEDKNLIDTIYEKVDAVSGTQNVGFLELCLIDDKYEEHFDIRFSQCTNDTFVALIRNMTDFQKQIKEINYLVNFDQLTGLLNRVNLRKQTNELIKYKDFPFVIVIADIIGVKLVNSSYGFEVGDIFIKEFADILINTQFGDKILGYYGGGQFCILLKNADDVKAEEFIKIVKDECKNHFIKDINISAAFGYYCMQDEHSSVDYAINTAEKFLFANKNKEYANNHIDTIEIINRTLQAKSPREQFHSDRVADLCQKFAKVYGFSEKEQMQMHTAGLLHDIGKIGIPENILDKPGRLTDQEFVEMRKHPEIGHKILEASGNMNEIADIIVSHHERWDGTGYPNGLKGNEIPLKSRMITIIDAYDAMVSDRSYRNGVATELAIKELIRCKDIQFDPELVDMFIDKIL